jgi:hypothetical protein
VTLFLEFAGALHNEIKDRQSPSNGSFYAKDCHCWTEIAKLSLPLFLASDFELGFPSFGHWLSASTNTRHHS